MKFSDMIGRVLAQISSGRWIITVAATACLMKLSWTLCDLMTSGKVTLETATYVAICMSILNTIGTITVFYFNKPRTDDGGNGNGDVPVITDSTTTLPPAKP
jgi:hypothetical protein